MNKLYIFFAYTSLFTIALVENARGPTYTFIIDQYGISTKTASLIFTVTSILGFLVNLTAKYWLGRISLKLLFRISCAFISLSALGIGFGLYTQLSFHLLLIFYALFGIAFASLSINMNILVKEGSNDRYRKKIFSGLHSMYGIASFLAPLGLNLFISLDISYSLYFVALSLPPLLLFLGAKKLDCDRPIFDKGLRKNVPGIQIRFLYGSLLGLYVSGEVFMSSRIPLFLERVEGLSPVDANFYLSLFFLFLLTGRLLFSFISLTENLFKYLYTSLILSLGFFAIGVWLNPVGYSLCGLSMSIFFPFMMELMARRFKDTFAYMSSSSLTFVGGGLILMHFIVGQLNELIGFYATFMLIPLILLSALSLLGLVHFRTRDMNL